MNRSLLLGGAAGTILAAAGATLAAYQPWREVPRYADVVDVQPLRETTTERREQCRDVTVPRAAPADKDRLAGTAVGALAGAVLGHQVGAGHGRDLAMVAGAAAGGYAGNRVEQRVQDAGARTVTRHECRTVSHPMRQVVGYAVTYRLDGRTATLRLPERPGPRIRILDGHWVPEGPSRS